PLLCAAHQLIGAAAGIDDRPCVRIIAMQALITLHPSYPDNRVIRPISRCNPGRTAAGLAHVPSKGYGGRICRRNLVSPKGVRLVMKRKICSLAGVVCNS